MKIIVQGEEGLYDMTKELLHILYNLRHWTKLWHEHYGGYYLNQKKLWEQRADAYLEKIQMTKSSQVSNINIQIDKNEAQVPTE